MATEFKRSDSQLTFEVGWADPHLTRGHPTATLRPVVPEKEPSHPEGCPACGLAECECPLPFGECSECHTPIFETDRWAVDIEGDRWCMGCWGKVAGRGDA